LGIPLRRPKVSPGIVPRVVHLVWDVELAVDMVQQAILSSCNQNCPAREAVSPGTVSWWSKELSHFKASTGWLFIQAKRSDDWESYRVALTCSNKEIRKARGSSCRNYCQEIKDVPDMARLLRIMTSPSADRVGSVQLPDG
jgi:hypothetical protein